MVIPHSLRSYIDAISLVSPAAWSELESATRKQMFSARDHICPFGRVAREVGLLASGWVRAYVNTHEGRPFTKHLFSAPGAVGDYASLLTGRPVQLAQQALTVCEVYWIPWKALQEVADRRSDVERLLRRYAETAYLLKEEREIELATKDATERYERVLQRYPGIEQALPQYEIAAYLAITPTQLSRIRASRVRPPHRS